MAFRRGIWGFGGVVLVAACSSGSGDAGGSTGEFISRYAALWCPAQTPCCTANNKTNDVGACKVFVSYAANASNGKLDQAKADQCLAALQGWTCDEPQPESCDEVFVGSTAPGGACKTSADCAPSDKGKVRCHVASSAGGTCKITPPAAAGQPCGSNAETATEHYDCDTDPGFYCDYDTSTCAARIAVGQDCPTGSGCVKDATCDYTTQKCVALTPVGGDCSSIQCVEDAYCDPSAYTCAAKKSVGEPCTSYDECLGSCDMTTNKCAGTGSSYSCFTTK